jgi:hypothetical protein
MQKSTTNGSQGGSGVGVIVGAAVVVMIVVGDGNVADATTIGGGNVSVASTFVFTTAKVSVAGVFTQEMRSNSRKKTSNCFIKDQALESASLLAKL